jgi:hypothetical protein
MPRIEVEFVGWEGWLSGLGLQRLVVGAAFAVTQWMRCERNASDETFFSFLVFIWNGNLCHTGGRALHDE